MSERTSIRPLAGTRVIDLTERLAGMTSRFLADLGAEVIRLDRSSDIPADELSRIHRATHHANKKSVLLDPEADADSVWQLLAASDIVVEDSRPADHDDLALSPARIRERLPRLIVVSVTDFGQDGPYRDWVATDAIHLALSGVLSRSGLPNREPLMPPGSLATESVALQAAWCALVALTNRHETGLGDHVDVSVYEGTTQVLDPGYGIGGSAAAGVPAADGPRGRPDARHLYPIFRCTDGWVRICVLAPRQWQGMFRWLGEPAELADPAYTSIARRFADVDLIHGAIGAMFADRTRAQIVEESQTYGVPAAALLEPHEVLEVDQFTAREAFVHVPSGDGDSVRVPNGLVVVDGERAAITLPAPVPGADGAEVAVRLASPVSAGGPATPPSDVRRHPLAGLRVLDLGVIVAGAEIGRLFADMGAEVIKVENRAFPDGGRQSLTGDAMTVSVAWGHRNKRGLGLNLRDPEGVRIFLDLVAVSDVVLSNFKPGTMESLGLAHDRLREINPGIITAESSAFGATGPWSHRMGYGPLVRAETGMSSMWRHRDVEVGFSDASTIYPDHLAARIGAVAVLALLDRRRRTGIGGTVDVSQAEAILSQYGPMLAAESKAPGSVINPGDLRVEDVPRGVFPASGDDEWVVIDVRGDADVQQLLRVIGVEDDRFTTRESRVEHRQDLDNLVSAWTVSRPPRAAMGELQRAGVPAAMMQRVKDLCDDEHLDARGFFRTMKHPLLPAPFPGENLPAHFLHVSDAPLEPAPLPGEHTRIVLGDVLGLDETSIDQLIADGVVEAVETPTVVGAKPRPAHEAPGR